MISDSDFHFCVNPQRDPPLSPYLGCSLPNPDGGNPVYFEHCRDSDGAMIDAKGHYEGFLSKAFGQGRIEDGWTGQAIRQLRAAQAAGGRQVEWWFYEQSSANFAKEVFERGGIGEQIVIRQLDYPGDAKWPYPASAPWARGRQKP